MLISVWGSCSRYGEGVWQADSHGVAKFVPERLEVYENVALWRARHLISPRWLEDMYCLPLCV